jgi:hypothetical protein
MGSGVPGVGGGSRSDRTKQTASSEASTTDPAAATPKAAGSASTPETAKAGGSPGVLAHPDVYTQPASTKPPARTEERTSSKGDFQALAKKGLEAKKAAFAGAKAAAAGASSAGPATPPPVPALIDADRARIASDAKSIASHINPAEGANELAEKLWSLSEAEQGELLHQLVRQSPRQMLEILQATTKNEHAPGGISAGNQSLIQEGLGAVYERGAISRDDLQALVEPARSKGSTDMNWLGDVLAHSGSPKLRNDGSVELARAGYSDAAIRGVEGDEKAQRNLLHSLVQEGLVKEFAHNAGPGPLAKLATDVLGKPPANDDTNALFDVAVFAARGDSALQQALGKYFVDHQSDLMTRLGSSQPGADARSTTLAGFCDTIVFGPPFPGQDQVHKALTEQFQTRVQEIRSDPTSADSEEKARGLGSMIGALETGLTRALAANENAAREGLAGFIVSNLADTAKHLIPFDITLPNGVSLKGKSLSAVKDLLIAQGRQKTPQDARMIEALFNFACDRVPPHSADVLLTRRSAFRDNEAQGDLKPWS